MGDGIVLKCAQCEKEFDVYFGAGFKDLFSEEVAQKAASGYFGEDWKTKYEKTPEGVRYYAEYALCVCPCCGEYWREVVPSERWGREEYPETIIKCGKCGTNVKVVTSRCELKGNLICKECGGEMKESSWICWD